MVKVQEDLGEEAGGEGGAGGGEVHRRGAGGARSGLVSNPNCGTCSTVGRSYCSELVQCYIFLYCRQSLHTRGLK